MTEQARIIRPYVLVLIAALGLSQEKPAPGIEGLVLDAQTGAPIKRAQIWLNGPQCTDGGALTDASGRFVLDNIDPGTYDLSARHSRYLDQRYGAKRPGGRGTALIVAPGQRLKDLEIRLWRAASVTGRVVDEDGQPLKGARVQIGRARRYVVPEAYTNDLGEYRLSGIPPGSYSVEATYRSPLPMPGPDKDMEMSYPPLFYPGVRDRSQSRPLDLKPGDEYSGIDFQMTPVTAVRVQGHIAASDGLVRVSAGRNSAVAEPGTGAFELRGLLPGSYLLCAQDHSHDFFARWPLEIGNSNITGLTLAVSPGATIRERIPVIEEACAYAKLDFAALGTHLRAHESFQKCDGESLPNGRVEADGRFQFTSVPPGRFWIDVSRLSDDFYLKEARLGRLNILESGIQVDSDDLDGVELVLTPFGGRIDGTVLDGEKNQAPHAQVILSPETKSQTVRTAWADASGRYSIRGIPPGEYRLFAWSSDEADVHDPTNLSDSDKKLGKEVEIEEKSHTTVELTLEDPR